MKSLRLIAVTGIVAALAVLTACTGGGTASPSGGGDDALSVGIVRFAPSEVNTEAIITRYTDLAEEAGWEVSTANPDASIDKAIGAMQDFVQKKVDLIIVSVFDSKTLAAGLRAAEEAGIPVASLAGGSGEGIAYDLVVANSVEVPVQMLEDMGGEGKVLALGFKPGLPCILREEALNQTLEGTDVVVDREEVVIPGQLESGQKFASAWLAKNPAGGGPLSIWACFDDPALGAVVAAQQAGRSDVRIYGYDGIPAGIRALREGTMRADSVADTDAAAKMIFDASPGIVERGVGADPITEELPFKLVTSDTVTEYLAAHPGADGS